MEQILIIEGIPGSGKDTLQEKLVKKYEKEYEIISFSEECLLWSWRHAWIKDIAKMRMKLMKNMLVFMEKEIKNNPKRMFILNRFHISFFHYNFNESFKKEYNNVLTHLKELPVKVYLTTMKREDIAKRSSHEERPKIWEEHLLKRLEWAGSSNITDMYAAEQDKILRIIENQEIRFKIIKT